MMSGIGTVGRACCTNARGPASDHQEATAGQSRALETLFWQLRGRTGGEETEAGTSVKAAGTAARG